MMELVSVQTVITFLVDEGACRSAECGHTSSG